MKTINEINTNELIAAIEEINSKDVFEVPITIKNQPVALMLKDFKEAIEILNESGILNGLSDETVEFYNRNDMHQGPYPWEAKSKKLLRQEEPPANVPETPAPVVETPAPVVETPAPVVEPATPVIPEVTPAEPKRRGRPVGWKKPVEQELPIPKQDATPTKTPVAPVPETSAPATKLIKKSAPVKEDAPELPKEKGGIYKKDIYPILMSLRAGLSAKSTFEEMASFMFTGKDVVTFNDNILVVCPFVTEFIATIKASDLLDVLKPLASDEFLKFAMKEDSNSLELQTQDANFNFQVVANDSGKLLGNSGIKDVVNGIRSELAQGTWNNVPENFKDASKLCSFSAAKKETLGILTCIAIHDKAAYSCDSQRISQYILSDAMSNFLISASVISTLLNYSIEKYCVTESWIGFQTKDGLTLGIRKKNGDYPIDLIGKILDQGSDFSVDAPIDMLKKAIEEVRVFTSSDESEELITVTIKGDMMYLNSKSSRGKAEASVEISSDSESGEEYSFQINPNFWLDILSKAPTMKLDMKNLKARFEAGKFCHVVALGIGK